MRDVRAVRAGSGTRGEAHVPPSKSHAIRCLIAACLASGRSVLTGLGDSPGGCAPGGGLPDDVARTAAALRELGFEVEDGAAGAVTVEGAAGALPRQGGDLDLGGSGTALRLLAAVCTLGRGPYVLRGDAALSARPFGTVADALRALGAGVETTPDGRPPVSVTRRGLRGGCEIAVDGRRSSHPVSALLLLAPALEGGLAVRPHPGGVSRAYVELTLATLTAFGVTYHGDPDGAIHVPGGGYRAADVSVERDWSSAAYLLAAGPVSGGRATVPGLDRASRQADTYVLDVLRAFGADVAASGDVSAGGSITRPADLDLSDAPDLAPLAGALACVAPGVTRVRGAPHLRLKETDRIAAVVDAARALGCAATARDDGFEVRGPAPSGAEVDPRGDHRIAMAFAVAGLALPGTAIRDPGCVAKSFPGFWRELDRLTGA